MWSPTESNMHAPQIIWVTMAAISLGIALGDHGKGRTGKHNVFITVIAIAINVSLLYWGGFFTN